MSEEKKEAKQPPPKGKIKFDLFIALATLANDKPEVAEALERDENEVRRLRAQIVSAARKNHILERELQEIDDKIKLLIKNRITVQEVIAQSQGLMEENFKVAEEAAMDKRLYEELFYLLQSKPSYLAKLARNVEAKDTPAFVQTVVFDMYGDQYDTREERLLLSMFKIMLQDELAAANDKGSLLRANTAVTQVLSAYAKRGQGLSVLKGVLEEPLRKITSQKHLNLEINPAKVYAQMITDYETKEGKESPLPKTVDDETAAANPDVQRLIAERSVQLLANTEEILTRIVGGVESIPYGMRWICRTLGELAKMRFPDIDRHQVGSLMGGYIYLRFFNPVIVTPDAINFVDTKPNRVMRRNLILIAKILQNLSNGLLFGDKEVYMKVANDFIREKTEMLQRYFHQLTMVEDLNEALQIDQFLEHTSSNVLQISLSQLALIHSLAQKNIDDIAPEGSDPLRDILKRLGPAPDLKGQGSRVLALSLSEARESRSARMAASADHFVGERVHPMIQQAKKSLLFLLRRLPAMPGKQTTLLGFLEEQLRIASAGGAGGAPVAAGAASPPHPPLPAPSGPPPPPPPVAGAPPTPAPLPSSPSPAPVQGLVESIATAISMLRTLNGMGLLPKEPTENETFNMFLWGFVQEALNRRSRVDATKKRLKTVQHAMETIETHHRYLISRLELYKMYLENVRKGQSQQGMVAAKPEKKKALDKVVKHTHEQLETMGIITQTNAAVKQHKDVLKKCFYAFSMVSPGRFKVELILRKGVDISLLKKPIEINLEDLLCMQEKGTASFELDYVTLHVNLLIHFLNTNFMVHVARS